MITRTLLETHLLEKLANHTWFDRCQTGDIAAFPYTLGANAKATIGKVVFPTLKERGQVAPTARETAPQFVLGMPMGKKPDGTTSYTHLQSKLELLRDEAFAKTAAASRSLVKKQLAIVVGINQIYSVDPAINRSFESYIEKAPVIDGIVHQVMGFFWKPVWEKTVAHPRIYNLTRAFLLLKAYHPEAAQHVRLATELSEDSSSAIKEQIPYQLIRETIKTSAATNTFVQEALTKAPKAPIYYTMMDDDFLSLRTGQGVFSHIVEAASTKPSLITPGYITDKRSHPFIHLAVLFDMAVRAAMSAIIPYSAYCPEPFSAVLIRHPKAEAFLNRLSFHTGGNNLESRRLIQKGRASGLLQDRMCFLQGAAITTTTPRRMHSKSTVRYKTFTSQQVKQKGFLKALRDLPQTHVHPKQWADNLYCALDFSSPRVTDATAPMMHIFGVFDPISRMYDTPHYSKKCFDSIMVDYKKPLSSAQKLVLTSAKTRLQALGMPSSMIDQIVLAAKQSGKAIYSLLKKASS